MEQQHFLFFRIYILNIKKKQNQNQKTNSQWIWWPNKAATLLAALFHRSSRQKKSNIFHHLQFESASIERCENSVCFRSDNLRFKNHQRLFIDFSVLMPPSWKNIRRPNVKRWLSDPFWHFFFFNQMGFLYLLFIKNRFVFSHAS